MKLAEGEAIVLTFEDFELKGFGDGLEIYDTLISNKYYVKSFNSRNKPKIDPPEKLILSGNEGLIRLKSFGCLSFGSCNTGRGFKIKINIGKITTSYSRTSF